MSLVHLLNKTCTIQTKTETQGATGSFTASWANTYQNVLCRYCLSNKGRGSVIAGSFQVTTEEFTFYFKHDQTISIADRISIDGKLFEVLHVNSDSSTHHLEVLAKVRSYD